MDIAAALRHILERIDGFISIERFESLTEPGKILSLSFFRDEAAVAAWRKTEDHRRAQGAGRSEIFANYRLHNLIRISPGDAAWTSMNIGLECLCLLQKSLLTSGNENFVIGSVWPAAATT